MVRWKCSANFPSLQQYHLDLIEQNVCNSDRVTRAPANGNISTASIWVCLGQWPRVFLCSHSHTVIPLSSPLLGGVCWVFIPNSWIVVGRCLLCVVFVVWVVCVVTAILQEQSEFLCSAPWTSAKEGPSLHLPQPGYLLPLPNCKFYLVSRRGETGFNLSLSSDTSNVSSCFMMGCGGCPSV